MSWIFELFSRNPLRCKAHEKYNIFNVNRIYRTSLIKNMGLELLVTEPSFLLLWNTLSKEFFNLYWKTAEVFL